VSSVTRTSPRNGTNCVIQEQFRALGSVCKLPAITRSGVRPIPLPKTVEMPSSVNGVSSTLYPQKRLRGSIIRCIASGVTAAYSNAVALRTLSDSSLIGRSRILDGGLWIFLRTLSALAFLSRDALSRALKQLSGSSSLSVRARHLTHESP